MTSVSANGPTNSSPRADKRGDRRNSTYAFMLLVKFGGGPRSPRLTNKIIPIPTSELKGAVATLLLTLGCQCLTGEIKTVNDRTEDGVGRRFRSVGLIDISWLNKSINIKRSTDRHPSVPHLDIYVYLAEGR